MAYRETHHSQLSVLKTSFSHSQITPPEHLTQICSLCLDFQHTIIFTTDMMYSLMTLSTERHHTSCVLRQLLVRSVKYVMYLRCSLTADETVNKIGSHDTGVPHSCFILSISSGVLTSIPNSFASATVPSIRHDICCVFIKCDGSNNTNHLY